MRKSIFNAFAIFISILGSFAVDRYISDINDQNSKIIPIVLFLLLIL